MSMVEVKELKKTFGDCKAVDGVSLSIADGEMLCLLGPSGCGKTTLLRLLSGFLEPDEGQIIMDGTDVTYQSPDKRPTSLVFQNYALFPHLNVFENIAFGLKVKKLPMAEICERVDQMLQVVGLEGMGHRGILQLSGGQQQRVALGRSLVMEPKVLLLDEPLSNLDAKLRTETREQIRSIQRRVGITSIFVTHDQEEALTLADRIAVMNCGRIEQVGCAQDIYHKPANRFVADFIGKSNFLNGNYDQSKEQFVLSDGLVIEVPLPESTSLGTTLSIRPEFISVTDNDINLPEGVNNFSGTVDQVIFLGERVEYSISLNDCTTVKAVIFGVSVEHDVGDKVQVYWSKNAGNVL